MPSRPNARFRLTTTDLGLSSGSGPSHAIVYGHEQDNLLATSSNLRLKDGSWSGGGGFFVHHKHLRCSTFPFPTIYSKVLKKNVYEGAKSTSIDGWKSTKPIPALPPSWATEQSLLNGHGATGWKRARPGNPTVSVANFVWELRDLPTLPLRLLWKLRNFRSLGSEYLNIQFGWLPFVKDVQDMYHTWQTLDQKLAQIKRDNGKGIRRRRKLVDTTETTSTVLYNGNLPTGAFYNAPGNYPGLNAGNYTCVKTVTTREHIWFAARFRYYIPDVESSEWTSRATRALFGAHITPSVMWEALPWSWLGDWFGNIGDIASNMSSNAVDNLTADYAFVMRHKTVTTRWESFGSWPTFSGNGLYGPIEGGSASAYGEETIETKSRAAATPYGFGVNFDGLSGYQASILAALGISRSRF